MKLYVLAFNHDQKLLYFYHGPVANLVADICKHYDIVTCMFYKLMISINYNTVIKH